MDACAETEGASGGCWGSSTRAGHVSKLWKRKNRSRELNSLRRQAIGANRTKAAAPLARASAPRALASGRTRKGGRGGPLVYATRSTRI